MIHRLLFSLVGNRKLIAFALRCWDVVSDGLVHPAVRIAGGLAATASGLCAVVYFALFRATLGASRRAIETSDDLTGDAGNVMDILELLGVVWLISGIVLIVIGLLVTLARMGGLVVIVGGLVWWAPLGFLALRLPAAPGLHAVAAVFLVLVIPAAVLSPAVRLASDRRTRPAAGSSADEA
ncbi:hypothetical protein OHA84_35420 [Streptomyces sp. NBC_00513]|uniref:hypothetical protein n=1 Tax=unclassified Streptomyces TaxID=2593676 RepID=UPI0022553125|nr:hypothetical protein [Streptomyces sp. NBC_00424]MCX5071197.1 hypothetical protein [Streptomyces sp. NBC_00424]WUD45387.1 hypothetical protein OHA84_35420 [Streptomyces sp. NBC_00513]